MNDIAKEELKGIVFVEAHNSAQLTAATQKLIDDYDYDTYEKLLRQALQRRLAADKSGEDGGGTRGVTYLSEALEKLQVILDR